jgi:hypothetical protein
VLVTKTLLFISVTDLQFNGTHVPQGWAQWSDPNWERKLMYVFDKGSGALLRVFEMDGFSAAAPMTYMYRGRQYIVVAVGGGASATELVAFGLPASNTH